MQTNYLNGKDPEFTVQLFILAKTLRCMKNESVIIEDDTCLDRILTLLKILSYKQDHRDIIHILNKKEEESFYSWCKHIIAHCGENQSSTAGFAAKLLPILSEERILEQLSEDRKLAWKQCVETFLSVDIADNNLITSFQYAWLASFSCLLSNSKITRTVVELEFDVEGIFQLTKSSSIFVERNAHLSISRLIVSLQQGLENEALSKSSLFKSGAVKILKSIGAFLRDGSPLNTALKVMTESLKLDFERAGSFFVAYLNSSSPFFEVKSIKDAVLSRCRNADTTVANFIASLTAVPIWMSSDFLHEIAVTSLVHSPLKVASYTLFSSIASIMKEKSHLWAQMALAPFQMVLGALIEEEDHQELASCKAVLDKCLNKRNNISTVLSNSVNAWLKIWNCGMLDSHDEEKAFMHFKEVLRSVYEVPDGSIAGVRPALLQNWKVSLSVLECIRACAASSEKCWLCICDITSTIHFVMGHVDSDHQVLSKSGAIALSLYRKRCPLHSSVQLLLPLLHCLLEKLNHLRWQERDSSLEVLRLLFEISDSSCAGKMSEMEKAFVEADLFSSLLSRMADSNSYVRSTATLAAKDFVDMATLRSVKELIQLLSSSVKILQNDAEAFPRRSAVLLMTSILFKKPDIFMFFTHCFVSTDNDVSCSQGDSFIEDKEARDIIFVANKTLREYATHDLDWEVKRNIILFFSKFYNLIINENTTADENLKNKAALCICSHLSALQNDYDKVVSECAYDVLSMINKTSDPNLQKDRKHRTLLTEFCSLLNDVEYRLTHQVPPLSHHVDNDADDKVIMDCY